MELEIRNAKTEPKEKSKQKNNKENQNSSIIQGAVAMN